MTSLVACLSTGKGTWITVSKLIKSGKFEKIFLITNDFGKEHFNPEEHVELFVVNPAKPVCELVEQIKQCLSGKILDTEVALNISSGSGKEHSAVISAILKLGLGIRFVDFEEGVVEV